jgi:purine catabolism regulator
VTEEDTVSLTVRELLSFAVFRPANPEVLVGGNGLDSQVRWVHSSEIFEMAPLLSAGDLLLTTGLGLASRGPAEQRQYIRDLSARGVAGLVFELGRSFADVPPDLVNEATLRRFPLIALHSVVPFIRITEAANTWIIDETGQQLRLGEEITRVLNESLISGAGIGGLLATASSLVRTSLILVAASGALVTAHGVNDDRSAWRAVDACDDEVPVTLHGQPWGRLVAGPGSELPGSQLRIALERTSVAVALAMLQTGRPPSGHDRQVTGLLSDLVGSDGIGDADLTVRAATAGFHPLERHFLLGLAAESPESAQAYAVIDRAARILGTPSLRSRVLSSVLAVIMVPPGPVDVVGAAQTVLEEARSRVGGEVRIAIGHAVPSSAGLSSVRASLRDARATLGLGGRGVVTSLNSALELQLIRYNDRAALSALAGSAIGPLISWDRDRHTSLVRTLEAYLRSGCSPTRTAATLRLGRQSLYQRLDRIQTLLGHPVDVPDNHAGLLLAAVAYRLSLVAS